MLKHQQSRAKKNICCPLLVGAVSRFTLLRWLATSFIGGAVIVLYLLPSYHRQQQQHRQVRNLLSQVLSITEKC
jgi:hypothetical protein